MQDILAPQNKPQHIESLEFLIDSASEKQAFLEETETFLVKLSDCSSIGTLKLSLLDNWPQKTTDRLFSLLQKKSIDNLILYLGSDEITSHLCELLEKSTAIKKIKLKKLNNNFSENDLEKIVASYQQNPIIHLYLSHPEGLQNLDKLEEHRTNNLWADKFFKKMKDFNHALIIFQDLADLLEYQAHIHYADARFLSPIYEALELICGEFAKHSNYRSIYNIKTENHLANIIQAKEVILVDQGPGLSILDKYQLILLKMASVYLPTIPHLMQHRETILDKATSFIFIKKDNLKGYFSSLTNADIAITCKEVEMIAREAILSSQNENNSNNETLPRPDFQELAIINEALLASTNGYTVEWFNLLVHCQSIRKKINKRYGTHKVVSLEEVFLGSYLGTKYQDNVDLQALYDFFKNGSQKIDVKSFEKSRTSLNHFIEGYYSTPQSRILIEDRTKTEEEKTDVMRGVEKAVENACPYALELYSSSGIPDDSDVEDYRQQSLFYHGYYTTPEAKKILNNHKNMAHILSTSKELDKSIEGKNSEFIIPRLMTTMVCAISAAQNFLATAKSEQTTSLEKQISHICAALKKDQLNCMYAAIDRNPDFFEIIYISIKNTNHQIILFLRDFEENINLEKQASHVLYGLNKACEEGNYQAALFLSDFYENINPQKAVRLHKLAYDLCDSEKAIFDIFKIPNNDSSAVHQKHAAIFYLEERFATFSPSQQPKIINLLHKVYYSILTHAGQLDIISLKKWLELYQKYPYKSETDLLMQFLTDYTEKNSRSLKCDPENILLIHKVYDSLAKLKKTKDIEEKWFDFLTHFGLKKEGVVLLINYHVHTSKNIGQACDIANHYCMKHNESLENFYESIFDDALESNVALTSWQEAKIKFYTSCAKHYSDNKNPKNATFLIQAAQMGNETALTSITLMYSQEAKRYPSRYLDLAQLYQGLSEAQDKDKTHYLKETYRYYLLAAQSGIDHAVCEIDRAVTKNTLPQELLPFYEETIWKVILKNIEDGVKTIQLVQQATTISTNPIFTCLQQTLDSPTKLNHFDEYWDTSRLPSENLKNLFFQYDKDYLLFSNLHHQNLANTIYKNLSQLKPSHTKKELFACFDVPDLIKSLKNAKQSGRMITMIIYAVKSIVNTPVPQPEVKIRPSIMSSRF